MTVSRSPFRAKRLSPRCSVLRHATATALAASRLCALASRSRYVLVLRNRSEYPKAHGHRPR